MKPSDAVNAELQLLVDEGRRTIAAAGYSPKEAINRVLRRQLPRAMAALEPLDVDGDVKKQRLIAWLRRYYDDVLLADDSINATQHTWLRECLGEGIGSYIDAFADLLQDDHALRVLAAFRPKVRT